MIIKADFLNHWKTKLLIKRLGDGPALTALISLWAYCEQRRAWQFSLSPLELAGVCDFGGDPQTLHQSLTELRFIQPMEDTEFIVNGWGEMNQSLVNKWPGRKLLPTEHYHPRGRVEKLAIPTPKPQPIPQPIPPPIGQAKGEAIPRAIREDRIGEEERNTPFIPQGGSDIDFASEADLSNSADQTPPPPHDESEATASRKKKKGARPSESQASVAIYAAYPKKVGRDAALRAIEKRIAQGHDPAELHITTQRFAQATAKWPAHDRQFIPHPATWFNQGRFADDPSTWSRTLVPAASHRPSYAPPEPRIDVQDGAPSIPPPPVRLPEAMAALYGADYATWAPSWYAMTHSDRTQINQYIATTPDPAP